MRLHWLTSFGDIVVQPSFISVWFPFCHYSSHPQRVCLLTTSTWNCPLYLCNLQGKIQFANPSHQFLLGGISRSLQCCMWVSSIISYLWLFILRVSMIPTLAVAMHFRGLTLGYETHLAGKAVTGSLCPPHPPPLPRSATLVFTPPQVLIRKRNTLSKRSWIESPSLSVIPGEFCLLWFANRMQTVEKNRSQKLYVSKSTIESMSITLLLVFIYLWYLLVFLKIFILK